MILDLNSKSYIEQVHQSQGSSSILSAMRRQAHILSRLSTETCRPSRVRVWSVNVKTIIQGIFYI